MPKRSKLIADLMVRLSVDPALRRRFKEDPVAVKDEMGLSDEDLELVAGGNPDRIREALGNEVTVNCYIVFVRDDG